MRTFSHILVDIDACADHQPAIACAVVLARATGAEVTIVDVTAPNRCAQTVPVAEEELVDLLKSRLDAVAADRCNVKTSVRLLIGPPVATLVEEVERCGADLVIRSRARDTASMRNNLSGPIDRQLIRACPAPVLLIGPGAPPQHPLVVGAIAPDDGRPDVAALNRTIADYALTMATLASGSCTLLQAWTPSALLALRDHGGDAEMAGYVHRRRTEVLAALEEVARQNDGRAGKIALAAQRGEIDDVLPEFVVSHGVDLVVIGVTPRRALSRLVLGNTAERLLQYLPCSVLAVKAGRESFRK